jgi:hypothetical protein
MMTESVLALLFAGIAPLPLLVVERFLPYPFIFEELVKYGVVWLMLKPDISSIRQSGEGMQSRQWGKVVLAAVLFTFSESSFYLVNYFALGLPTLFFLRLAISGCLHLATFLWLAFCLPKGKWWAVSGLFLAMLCHAVWNVVVK